MQREGQGRQGEGWAMAVLGLEAPTIAPRTRHLPRRTLNPLDSQSLHLPAPSKNYGSNPCLTCAIYSSVATCLTKGNDCCSGSRGGLEGDPIRLGMPQV